MNLWLRCPALHNCSWTIVWKELRDALIKQGHNVYDDYINHKPDNDCIEIYWGDPARFRWGKSKVKIAYVLSEADLLQSAGRKDAIKNLQKADLIICPSEYSSRAYLEMPIDIPIKVVPLGHDDNKFQYLKRNWNEKPFRFLLAGAAQFRKGTWLGIEAFIMAFKNSKRVQLTVHSAVKTPDLAKYQDEYIADNIVFDETNVEDMNEIYKNHHVLLSPHLSEGFGLIVIEAMATGMCCIVSRVSSPREFFTKECGYWNEMSNDYAPIGDCLKDTIGFWRLPDIDDLANKMKIAYVKRKASMEKGMLASSVAKNYTWANTASRLVQIIKEANE
jgi:glycosyltransferase involved in cell wall biosynthesis